MWRSPGLYTWTTIVHNLYKRFSQMSTTCNPGMFADDTYITTAHEEISTIECSLNSDLIAVHNLIGLRQTN